MCATDLVEVHYKAGRWAHPENPVHPVKVMAEYN